jgi:hypothetical protein
VLLRYCCGCQLRDSRVLTRVCAQFHQRQHGVGGAVACCHRSCARRGQHSRGVGAALCAHKDGLRVHDIDRAAVPPVVRSIPMQRPFNTFSLTNRSGAPPLATPESLEASLGMSAAAITRRWLLVQQTNALLSPPLPPGYRFAQGVPDFQFPPFECWARFNFVSVNNVSQQLWPMGRIPLQRCGKSRRPCDFETEIPSHSSAATVSMSTDDPRIQPPLSQRETAFQCAGLPPPCALKWEPGWWRVSTTTAPSAPSCSLQACSATPCLTSLGAALAVFPPSSSPATRHALRHLAIVRGTLPPLYFCNTPPLCRLFRPSSTRSQSRVTQPATVTLRQEHAPAPPPPPPTPCPSHRCSALPPQSSSSCVSLCSRGC